MRKILSILFIFTFVLLGCGISEFIEEKGEKDESLENQKFLEKMESTYSKFDRPKNVLVEVDKHYDEIENEKVKEKLVDLVNKATIKILKGDDHRELNERNSYTVFFERNSFDILYDVYLTDEVKQEVYNKLHPVGDILLKSGYNIEFIDEYNDVIKINDSIITIESWLKDNDVDYNFIDNSKSHLLVMTEENIVIHANDNNVLNIFKMKGSDGTLLDPTDILKDAANRIVINEDKYLANSMENRKREEEESEKVKIGMTTEQVEKRMGSPKDINRTTTESYVKEQWVYHNGVYLYFENDILTTIQD